MDFQQVAFGEEDESVNLKKKGVQFHTRNSLEEVQRISRFSTYDPEEITAYWGDDDEHQLRKEELKSAVMDWQMGRRNSDNLSFSMVGLEDKVGPGRTFRKEMRWRSRTAVMDEQSFQAAEGVYDDEQLASVYKITSQEARLKAQEVARRLASDVEGFQTEDLPDNRNTI